MENITSIISTVGFPIACVLGMGYFIYVAFKMFMSKSDKREDRLYDLVSEVNEEVEESVGEELLVKQMLASSVFWKSTILTLNTLNPM